MNGQDSNVTYSTPSFPDAIERILGSKSQVVKIAEIDASKLEIQISHTTSSGILLYRVTEHNNHYFHLQVNQIYIFQAKASIPLGLDMH